MKFSKPYMTLIASGVSLIMWAEPKPSITPFPGGDSDNDVLIETDDAKPGKSAGMGGFLPRIAVGDGLQNRESASQVSVLCFKDPDQKAIGETTEDLAVLSVLLSRNLEQTFTGDTDDYKLGIPMLLTAGKQAITASYIQGFGAILKMQVRFPVVAPPEGMDETPTAKKNSEWDTARRELLAENNPEFQWDAGAPGLTTAHTEARPYDAKLVQTLKKRVLTLLKNAAHIRHLEGNEWIIVKIVGSPNSSRNIRAVTVLGDIPVANYEPHKGNESISTTTVVESDDALPANPVPAKKSRKHAGGNNRVALAAIDEMPVSNRPTIMSLRVKKSAADAFEAGSLSEEQFIKEAEVATYLNPVLPGAGRKTGNELILK